MISNNYGSNDYKDGSVSKEVQDILELKIMSGELAPGNRFPSIRELAETYDIGTSTAQMIVNNLSAEDIIVKKRGVGFFVKPFVKGKLRDKHIDECMKMFERAIKYADILGLDSKTIVTEVLEEKKK